VPCDEHGAVEIHMPISLINEFIYHLKQRTASSRRIPVELSQEDIRELARIRAELELEREKQNAKALAHRLFML
jgi:hypothetical protein